MANTFKSNVSANIVTSGNTIYTCPSATQTTLIGMTLANKSAGTVTANVFLTRSAVDYSIISNAPIITGSTLVHSLLHLDDINRVSSLNDINRISRKI